MEIEAKFNITVDLFEKIANDLFLENEKIYKMNSIYYDTVDEFLSKNKCGLRLRRENDISVCCLKIHTKNELIREEYEVFASDIYEGIKKLDNSFLNTVDINTITESCKVNFIRHAYVYETSKFKAEFALDSGEILANNKKEPLLEMEIEYKSGDEHSFMEFINIFQNEYNLEIETKSKLLRGILLKNK